MRVRWWIVTMSTLVLVGPVRSEAAKSGVQWTLDGTQLLVNKDVGQERWAITLNLADFSATGNVFPTNGDEPSFIWCQKSGESFDGDVGELNLQYSCFGANRGVGGFSQNDWTLISDGISIPLSFFIPDTETCDLSGALNGPNAANASSEWSCGGSAGQFRFRIFADGTAFNSAKDAFTYDAISEACRIAQLDDGSFLDLEYSPSRDHLTIYETEITTDVDRLIVSECTRANL